MDLVSVVVVTFNSEKTIIDTLESIFNLTYEQIELIIQDDCSADDTVEVVKTWCEQERCKNRFARIEVGVNVQNEKTAKNCNIACGKSNGRWIKLIAGDDMLFPDCIENNLNYLQLLDEEAIIMSRVIPFYSVDGVAVYRDGESFNNRKYYESFNKADSLKQYRMFLKEYAVSSPTFFYSKKLFEAVGGFDTQYGIMEDWPFVVKCAKMGYCFRYLDKDTVFYRIGNPDTERAKHFYNLELLSEQRKFKRTVVYKQIPWWNIGYYYNELILYFVQTNMIYLCKNKVNYVTSVINYFLTWLPPYNWRAKIQGVRQKRKLKLEEKRAYINRI